MLYNSSRRYTEEIEPLKKAQNNKQTDKCCRLGLEMYMTSVLNMKYDILLYR